MTSWYQPSGRVRTGIKERAIRKGIIELLLIILGAIVVVMLGLYGGLASSHHR